MMSKINAILLSLLMLMLLVSSAPALAQFGKLKDKAKEKIERKVDTKTDKAMDDALDDAEDAVEGKDSEKTTTATKSENAKTTKLRPGEGAWLNYDFVPGDRVLYYQDFSTSPVGDFPLRVEFVEGNMEVAEWEGARYLRVGESAKFEIPLPENLSEDFTLEMNVYMPKSYEIRISEGSTAPKRAARETYWAGFRTDSQTNLKGGLAHGSKYVADSEVGRDIGTFDIRWMMSGSYAKVYANEMRLANVPNADVSRADRLLIQVRRNDNRVEEAVMIKSIRIAEGGKKILYDELAASGRVATQGIYFDSGSDNLRPESTPTLKEIGTMLQEHADLRLLIEGHTDAMGEEGDNLKLSDDRAAAVKTYLIETYDLDGSRLETKGFGESNAVDSNETAEGRQNNRRVELVKLS